MDQPQPSLTLEAVLAEVKKLDPSIQKDHRHYQTAVFMMAAFMGIGQSDVALHKFTGFSRGFLIRRIKRLKAAGVWANGKFNHRWLDAEVGAAEFRLDLKIAEGELREDDGADAD